MSGDRGLAGERTELAWRRSGISLVVAGIAVLRGVPTIDGVPSRPLAGTLILALGAATFFANARAAARRRHHASTRPAAELSDLAPVALTTALVAAAAIVVALISTR